MKACTALLESAFVLPSKKKTASFFEPYMFGVASPHKAERIIMVRACVDERRSDDESGYEEHL